MIKKPADDLVVRLMSIHVQIEDVLKDYMNEYADYGWDSICTDITNIGAAVDALTFQIKYARVAE